MIWLIVIYICIALYNDECKIEKLEKEIEKLKNKI